MKSLLCVPRTVVLALAFSFCALANADHDPFAGSTPEGAPPTFADVAPIIYQNCTPCHHDGGGAPMYFESYKEIQKRAKLIAHVTGTGFMPPWKAAPGDVSFKNERHLDDDQVALLAAWVEAGMPLGDESKVPEAPTFDTDWHLGEPDLILEMEEEMPIPATGPDIYRGFVIRIPELPEGTYLKGIDYKPRAIESAHHTLFSLDATGTARAKSEAQPRPGYGGMESNLSLGRIGGWAVGARPHFYPEGVAVPLEPGTDLILATHFHPGGKEEVERAQVGLYLTDEPPTKHMLGLDVPFAFGLLANIRIPAGAKEHVIEDSFTLPVDTELVGVAPHAHYIGKTMTATATLPNGEQKRLIHIEDWDFAWQEQYRLAEPLPLPAGTRIDTHFVFDNSSENPRNPHDPPVEVTFGPESTDEMACITMGLMTEDREQLATLKQGYVDWVKEAIPGADFDIILSQAHAQRRDRMDLNGDGSIALGEFVTFAGFAWDRFRGGSNDDIEAQIVPVIAKHVAWTVVIPRLIPPGIILLALVIAGVTFIRRRRRIRRARYEAGSHAADEPLSQGA